MKYGRILLSAAVLIILAGILYWSQNRPPSSANVTSSAEAPLSLVNFGSNAITSLTILKRNAPTIALEKQANQWRITQPAPLPADQDAVASLVAGASVVTADRLVEDKARDLKLFGLSQPSITVEIGAKGKRLELEFGDDTPTGGDVYAMLDGAPKIFAVASYVKSGFNKSLNDLRDKRLITLDPAKVDRVVFSKKSQTMEFSHSKDGWVISQPTGLRADSDAVDDFVHTIAGATMNLDQAAPADMAEKFARAHEIGTVTLSADKTEQTVDVRQYGDRFYAKSSVVDGVYQVDSSLGQALEKNLDDFRNKKLFEFGFEEPDSIEVQNKANTSLFTRKAAAWWSNGKKVDTSGVELLVSKLRDLTATGFTRSPNARFDTGLIVSSNQGKESETVQIAKAGKDYVARRDHESSLYALSASVVDDILNTAGAIKPAAATTKKSSHSG